MPTTAPPNLYIVGRSGRIGYGEPFSFVVAARGPVQARKVVTDSIKDQGMYEADRLVASFERGASTYIGRAKHGTAPGTILLEDWTSD